MRSRCIPDDVPFEYCYDLRLSDDTSVHDPSKEYIIYAFFHDSLTSRHSLLKVTPCYVR